MSNHLTATPLPPDAELRLRQADDSAECGCGAPDLETSRRLRYGPPPRLPRGADRPIRLADVRKVM